MSHSQADPRPTRTRTVWNTTPCFEVADDVVLRRCLRDFRDEGRGLRRRSDGADWLGKTLGPNGTSALKNSRCSPVSERNVGISRFHTASWADGGRAAEAGGLRRHVGVPVVVVDDDVGDAPLVDDVLYLMTTKTQVGEAECFVSAFL